MTHLPYILGAYGLTGALALTLSIGAMLRLRRAKTRLASFDAKARPASFDRNRA